MEKPLLLAGERILVGRLKLKDRVSGGFVWLALRDGVVVGAMGADPARFVGLTEDAARHLARYGGKAPAAGELTKNQARLLAKLRDGETFHDLPHSKGFALNLAALVKLGLARRVKLPWGAWGWEAVDEEACAPTLRASDLEGGR